MSLPPRSNRSIFFVRLQAVLLEVGEYILPGDKLQPIDLEDPEKALFGEKVSALDLKLLEVPDE